MSTRVSGLVGALIPRVGRYRRSPLVFFAVSRLRPSVSSPFGFFAFCFFRRLVSSPSGFLAFWFLRFSALVAHSRPFHYSQSISPDQLHGERSHATRSALDAGARAHRTFGRRAAAGSRPQTRSEEH